MNPYDNTDFNNMMISMLNQYNSRNSAPQEELYDYADDETDDNYDYYTELEEKLLALEEKIQNYQMQSSNEETESDELFDYIMNSNDSNVPVDWSNIQLPEKPSFTNSSSTKSSGNEQKAFSYFLSKGYTPEQASGIVANIKHESGFNTQVYGDNGKAQGLVQWHPDRRKYVFDYLETKGLNPYDFDSQLEGIDYELRTRESKALSKLKSAKTAAEAAHAFDKYYERSAGLSTKQRQAYAEQFYNQMVNR